MTPRSRRYFKRKKNNNDVDNAWMCSCGNWQEDGLHCDICGGEPPWGCPCDVCQYYGDDSDDEDIGEDDPYMLADRYSAVNWEEICDRSYVSTSNESLQSVIEILYNPYPIVAPTDFGYVITYV